MEEWGAPAVQGGWRFKPPPDGAFVNEQIPRAAVAQVVYLIMKVAAQGRRQDVLEHFKGYFCEAAGAAHLWSTSESWAETALWTCANEAARNAPLFIEAFFDACVSFAKDDTDLYAPDVDIVEAITKRLPPS